MKIELGKYRNRIGNIVNVVPLEHDTDGRKTVDKNYIKVKDTDNSFYIVHIATGYYTELQSTGFDLMEKL